MIADMMGRGSLWEAEKEYLSVIAALREEIGRGNRSLYPGLARAYCCLAEVYSETVLLSEEESTLNQALEIWKLLSARGEEDGICELARVYFRLGIVYKYQGKWDASETALVRSEEILAALVGGNPGIKAELTQCAAALGNVYWILGRLEDAEKKLLYAVRLWKKLPADPPDMLLKSLGFAHCRLAEIYRKQFRMEDAASNMFRSIDLYSRVGERAGVRRILMKDYDFLIDLFQCTGRDADELIHKRSLV